MTEARSAHYRRQFLIFAVASLLLLALALAFSWNNARLARAAEKETLAYNHGKHVAAGIQCIYCHPGVLAGPVAGIPSTAKCMGCHQTVRVSSAGQADVDLLIALWQAGEPLRWRKTFDQPDFVYFGHRPHIAAELACERCHGAVAEMAYLEQTIRHNMGFCLSCHRQPEDAEWAAVVQYTVGGAWRLLHAEPAQEKIVRLESCSTCHQ